jgi:hypothetical protein
MRHVAFATALSGIVLVGACALSAQAAVLADWKLGEATSGQVDPTFPHQNNFNPTPGAPLAPSRDNANNPSRDMARMRADTGGYNFRNQVNYDSLAGHTTGGFVGTATYHLPYPTQDLRGIYSGHDGSSVLTSRNADAFSNADLSGGFTYEVLWRPAIGQFQRLSFDGGGNVVMANGSLGVLTAIEGYVAIGFRDADPTAGVDPRIFYTIAGSSGLAIETALDLNLLKDDTDHFFHVVGVYEPSAAPGQQQRLYLDGALVASSSAFTLSNIDLNNGGTLDFRLSTIGGTPSPSNPFTAYAYIDAVKLSSGVLPDIQWLIPLPEPSSVALLGLGGLMMCRRRRTR